MNAFMGRFTRSMLLLLLLFDLLLSPGPFWPWCCPWPGGPCPPPPGCVCPPPMCPWELGFWPWWPPWIDVWTGDIEWGIIGGDLRSRLYEGCEWTRAAGLGFMSSINIPPWWWLNGEPLGSSGAKSPRQNDAMWLWAKDSLQEGIFTGYWLMCGNKTKSLFLISYILIRSYHIIHLYYFKSSSLYHIMYFCSQLGALSLE